MNPSELGTIAVGVTIGANIFALVWGAARINGSVEHLTRTVLKLDGALEKIAEKVGTHEVQIQVLHTKVVGQHVHAVDP